MTQRLLPPTRLPPAKWFEAGPFRTGIPVTRRVVEFAVTSGKWTLGFLIAWAFAAGAWRALPRRGSIVAQPTTEGDWFWFGLTALGYGAGALVAVVLAGLAALILGAALGFLFGVPRSSPLPNSMAGDAVPPTPRPAGSGAENAALPTARADAADEDRRRRGMTPSPALSEIADWLTKIIVGVGLIQAREIGSTFSFVVQVLLQNAGLVRYPLAGVIVPSVLIGGILAGFVLGWLVTSIRLSHALALAADAVELREAQEKAARLQTELRTTQSALQEVGSASSRVVQSLYEGDPKGALRSIEALFDGSPALRTDALLRRWEACALGQIHAGLAPDAPERAAIEQRAYEALQQAIASGDSLTFLQILANPQDRTKVESPQGLHENDLESFFPIPRFRKLLKLGE